MAANKNPVALKQASGAGISKGNAPEQYSNRLNPTTVFLTAVVKNGREIIRLCDWAILFVAWLYTSKIAGCHND